MRDYFSEGTSLKLQIKKLVLDYMKNTAECSPYNDGMRQAEIFRACGLDWGNYENATSSNQQYWIVGLLRELEKEGFIQKDETTKKWKMK